MTVSHLKDLRNALEANHWRIVREVPVDDDNIVVAVWEISRPDGSNCFSIEFHSGWLDGGGEIEEAGTCHVTQAPLIGLHFARINRSWKSYLATFMDELNELSVD
ncbi:MAG: hypothetical protein QNJ92_11540 [Alphaproteobacteria bacterium]|nr:hypothetical protein [Alphaproteobacteria bacterium]